MRSRLDIITEASTKIPNLYHPAVNNVELQVFTPSGSVESPRRGGFGRMHNIHSILVVYGKTTRVPISDQHLCRLQKDDKGQRRSTYIVFFLVEEDFIEVQCGRYLRRLKWHLRRLKWHLRRHLK